MNSDYDPIHSKYELGIDAYIGPYIGGGVKNFTFSAFFAEYKER